ncbi:peptide deformylase [Enterococcus sp. PF1-24]|uniref:peptide deformylase n=1 Tax=unclassified Enterococcus TaxID=2608891 RepID=UPI002475E8E9|nr:MULTISPECIES: peptide deformylase [unclassified Enterococcus]MDH6364290.1 peptide deformylase [Enterococcus sp. PFB1-1]MDH6401351.1 peptide deformylase [Enterococcus sp. PF1-24]
MRYPIILYPDQRLQQVAEPVQVITDEIIELLDNLYETMMAHDGVGLAAPQVGRNLQVAVVEVEENDRIELINPQIIQKTGSDVFVEGCLSIPETYGTVERAGEIVVRYFDREGEEMELTAYDYLARAIQHEVDHLNGILFIEKVIEKIPVDQLEAYIQAKEEEEADD